MPRRSFARCADNAGQDGGFACAFEPDVATTSPDIEDPEFLFGIAGGAGHTRFDLILPDSDRSGCCGVASVPLVGPEDDERHRALATAA